MPQPPRGAAPALMLPAPPNRDLSPAASVWHMRAALNVAALGCPGLAPAYNRLLAAQKRSFAEAYRALKREYPNPAAFDSAMTRLYNYFSQPAPQQGFCAVASRTLAEATAVAPARFGPFASAALIRLDQPFADFYAAYADYRSDLARWQAGEREAPRLAYPAAVFMASDEVIGGGASAQVATR